MVKLSSADTKGLKQLVDTFSYAYTANEDVVIPAPLIREFFQVFDKTFEIPGYLNITKKQEY